LRDKTFSNSVSSGSDEPHASEVSLAYLQHALESGAENALRVFHYVAIDTHRALLELAAGLRVAGRNTRCREKRRQTDTFSGNRNIRHRQQGRIALAAHNRVPAGDRLFCRRRIMEARGQLPSKAQLRIARIQRALANVTLTMSIAGSLMPM
jgi:hypothetical protein